AFAAQRRKGRFAAGPDVAAQLGELIDGDVDPVLSLVFEIEVVAGDTADLASLEAGEAGDAVVLVDDVVADAQSAERGTRAGGAGNALFGTPPAVDEAAERVDGEAELGTDEPLAQARLGERETGIGRKPAAVEQRRVQPVEAVTRSLRLAAVVEGD